MAKPKFETKILAVGLFDGFDETNKKLPKIIEYTKHLIAEVDKEFGLIVNIKRAKGKTINWRIQHPGIVDELGEVRPPFQGSEFIKNNDWSFYLGDTLWEPLDDKGGDWRMTIELEGQLIADETCDVEYDEYKVLEDDSFWMNRRKNRL